MEPYSEINEGPGGGARRPQEQPAMPMPRPYGRPYPRKKRSVGKTIVVIIAGLFLFGSIFC